MKRDRLDALCFAVAFIIAEFIIFDLLQSPTPPALAIGECNQGFVESRDTGWVICDEGKWYPLNADRVDP